MEEWQRSSPCRIRNWRGGSAQESQVKIFVDPGNFRSNRLSFKNRVLTYEANDICTFDHVIAGN